MTIRSFAGDLKNSYRKSHWMYLEALLETAVELPHDVPLEVLLEITQKASIRSPFIGTLGSPLGISGTGTLQSHHKKSL